MKSHVSVLLASDTPDVPQRLREVLEIHRLNEDDEASVRSHHWDYWYFPVEGEWSVNACAVADLPPDYGTSGVLLEDGSWHDLQDHGWRMMREPSTANLRALEEWDLQVERIFSLHRDHLCVQVIVHS